MINKILVSGARLQFIKSSGDEPLNWVFLPGGPGLGSESLYPLIMKRVNGLK